MLQTLKARLGGGGLVPGGGPLGSGATQSNGPSSLPIGTNFLPQEPSFYLKPLSKELGSCRRTKRPQVSDWDQVTGRSLRPKRVYSPVCRLAQWDPESRKRTDVKAQQPGLLPQATWAVGKTPPVRVRVSAWPLPGDVTTAKPVSPPKMGMRLIGLLPRVLVRSEMLSVRCPAGGAAGAVTIAKAHLCLSRADSGQCVPRKSAWPASGPVGESCSSALSLGVCLGLPGRGPRACRRPPDYLEDELASLQCIICATLQCPGLASL